jgi:uncharacterized protein YecT (DUF1311 family)
MRHYLVLVPLLLLLGGAAAPMQSFERFRISNAESERVVSGAYRRCMDASGGVTANMRDCSHAESQRLDLRLNAAYRAAMARLPAAAARARLRALQRSWLAARYRRCDRAAREEGGGTLGLIMMDDCALGEVTRRIVWLERYGRRP